MITILYRDTLNITLTPCVSPNSRIRFQCSFARKDINKQFPITIQKLKNHCPKTYISARIRSSADS